MNFLNLFAQTPALRDDYSSSTYPSPDTSFVAGYIMLLMLFVFIIAVYVTVAYLTSRIFKKAGIEGWKAWVPIYNGWVLLEVGGQNGAWILLSFFPILSIVPTVFTYIAMYHIGLKLGKPELFILWGIFLPIVWYVWLAFDDSTWQGNNQGQTPQVPTFTPPTTPAQA